MCLWLVGATPGPAHAGTPFCESWSRDYVAYIQEVGAGIRDDLGKTTPWLLDRDEDSVVTDAEIFAAQTQGYLTCGRMVVDLFDQDEPDHETCTASAWDSVRGYGAMSLFLRAQTDGSMGVLIGPVNILSPPADQIMGFYAEGYRACLKQETDP